MTYEGNTFAKVRLSAFPMRRLPVRCVRWHAEPILRDATGRPRHAITMPGYRRGVQPVSTGRTFPADPPTAGEVMALIEACNPRAITGRRNATIVLFLWRSGVRISECFGLVPGDLNPEQGTIRVRHGKGNKARTIGMDRATWLPVAMWMAERAELPAGPLFCVTSGPTRGRGLHPAYARAMLPRLARKAGVTRRLHPHACRHACACEMAREGVALHLISRHLGHSNLGTTATYLAGISPTETIDAVLAREIPAGAS